MKKDKSPSVDLEVQAMIDAWGRQYLKKRVSPYWAGLSLKKPTTNPDYYTIDNSVCWDSVEEAYEWCDKAYGFVLVRDMDTETGWNIDGVYTYNTLNTKLSWVVEGLQYSVECWTFPHTLNEWFEEVCKASQSVGATL